MAITGFVFGVLSVLVLVSLVAAVAAPLPGIAGLVLGIIGLTRARKTGHGGGLSWWAVSLAGFTLLAWCGLLLIGMANAGVI